MSENGNTCWNVFWDVFSGTIEMAVLFIPILFLSNFIASKSQGWASVLFHTGVILTGFAAVSSKARWSITKIILSIPLSRLLLKFFVETGFQVRGVNYWYHDYGWLTAGSYFAINMGFFVLAIFECFMAFLGTVLCPLYRKLDRPTHPVLIIKNWICPLFCVGIYIAVYYLERLFPTLLAIQHSYI